MGAADTRVTRNTYLSPLCSFVQTCSRLLKKNEQRSSRNGIWRRGSNHSGIRRVYFNDRQLFRRTGFYTKPSTYLVLAVRSDCWTLGSRVKSATFTMANVVSRIDTLRRA